MDLHSRTKRKIKIYIYSILATSSILKKKVLESLRLGIKHAEILMLVLLEQNVFNNTTLSFDDNKVLKISIRYANICSSVQDHRQKFKCL